MSRDLWHAAHKNIIVSRELRAAAHRLAAEHLTGDQLRQARYFLNRCRTTSDIHQFMARLNTHQPGPDTRPS